VIRGRGEDLVNRLRDDWIERALTHYLQRAEEKARATANARVRDRLEKYDDVGSARVILEKGCAVVNFASEHCPCVLCRVVLWRVAC